MSSLLSQVLPVALPVGAAIGALGYATFSPQSRIWGPLISRGTKSDAPGYALTFDDGPTSGPTDRILDLLGELNVKAAFFVIGVNVQKSPDLIARMHREGHVVANHSFDHARLGGLGPRGYWDRQLRMTDDVIKGIIGVRPALFRPPLGIKTWRVLAAVRANAQKTVVMWSRRGVDGVYPSTARILRRLGPTRNGDILLLHDGVEPNSRRDQTPTVESIKPLITRLRDRGLEAARLDELIGLPAYV